LENSSDPQDFYRVDFVGVDFNTGHIELSTRTGNSFASDDELLSVCRQACEAILFFTNIRKLKEDPALERLSNQEN